MYTNHTISCNAQPLEQAQAAAPSTSIPCTCSAVSQEQLPRLKYNYSHWKTRLSRRTGTQLELWGGFSFHSIKQAVLTLQGLLPVPELWSSDRGTAAHFPSWIRPSINESSCKMRTVQDVCWKKDEITHYCLISIQLSSLALELWALHSISLLELDYVQLWQVLMVLPLCGTAVLDDDIQGFFS